MRCALLILVIFAPAAYPAWLEGWEFRKEVTIQDAYVDANLSSFPVYVPLAADADLHEARADGYDIRFTQSDGETTLPYDREYWTGGNGSAATASLYVLVPTILATGGATIYMYYGKADAADDANATATWDAYAAVYHLHDPNSGTSVDSTGNGYTGTQSGTAEGTGKIAQCEDWSSDFYDYITLASCPHGEFGSISVSAWCHSPSYAEDGSYSTVILNTYASSSDYLRFGVTSGGALYCGLKDGGVNVGKFSSNAINTSSDAWYHVAFTWDTSTYVNYINASADTTSSCTNTSGSGNWIGTRDTNNGCFYGGIDEVRIILTSLSASWIKFEYNNIAQGDNELTWGSEEEESEESSAVVSPHVINAQDLR